MQFGNNVLLFNCVNQISANGKKGKTPQKLTKQKEQDDRAFRLKLPGLLKSLMAGDGSNSFHNMAK